MSTLPCNFHLSWIPPRVFWVPLQVVHRSVQSKQEVYAVHRPNQQKIEPSLWCGRTTNNERMRGRSTDVSTTRIYVHTRARMCLDSLSHYFSENRKLLPLAIPDLAANPTFCKEQEPQKGTLNTQHSSIQYARSKKREGVRGRRDSTDLDTSSLARVEVSTSGCSHQNSTLPYEMMPYTREQQSS